MIVVDASVWISVLVQVDAFHEQSSRWLISTTDAGERFAGPNLVLAEVAGGISRKLGMPAAGTTAISAIERSPGLRIVHPDEELARRAAALAATLGLRGADAVYVATAEHLSCPLVTWDNDVLNKARNVITVTRPTP